MAKSKSKSDKRSKPTTKVQDSKTSNDKRTATKKETAKEIKKSKNEMKKNVDCNLSLQPPEIDSLVVIVTDKTLVKDIS